MSIKLEFSKGSLRTEAVLKDEAFAALMDLCAKYQTEGGLSNDDGGKGKNPIQIGGTKIGTHSGDDQISKVKQWLSKHTASEVLNQIKWETYPEKILLLGAYHEADGGEEGWKSSDIEERFAQAKDDFPANFPRDIKTAVSDGIVGAVTPRTYKIGRAGWNKIAAAIEKL